MDVKELINLVDGKLLNPSADLHRTISGAGGADLMSDVLASIQPEAVLLTGLCNPQIVRTAVMADVSAIVLVRGKIPPDEIIALAEQEQIPLITSKYGMFELCGRLYSAGLNSLETDMGGCDCAEI